MAYGGDVSEFVRAGKFTDASQAPESLAVHSKGFDGQFFYRLAVSPLSTKQRVAGVRFDIPPLRQQRVLYPAIAWGVSLGGRAALVPWALLIVNIVGFALIAWAGGCLALSAGRHTWWGALFVLYPGFLFSLTLDLAEIIASAMLLWGVVALRADRPFIAAVVMALAILARETTAILPISIVVALLWFVATGSPQARDLKRWVAGTFPLLVAVAWQLQVRAMWGSLPLTSSSEQNIRLPLTGLIDQIPGIWPPVSLAAAFRVLSLIALLLVIGIAAWRLGSSPIEPHEKVAWLISVLVLTLLGGYIWAGATSFMRAATEAYLFSALVVVGSSTRLSFPFALTVAALWPLTALSQLLKALGVV